MKHLTLKVWEADLVALETLGRESDPPQNRNAMIRSAISEYLDRRNVERERDEAGRRDGVTGRKVIDGDTRSTRKESGDTRKRKAVTPGRKAAGAKRVSPAITGKVVVTPDNRKNPSKLVSPKRRMILEEDLVTPVEERAAMVTLVESSESVAVTPVRRHSFTRPSGGLRDRLAAEGGFAPEEKDARPRRTFR